MHKNLVTVLAENIRRAVKHVNDDDLKMLSKTFPELFAEMNEKTKQKALETYKAEMTKQWPGSNDTQDTLMDLHDEQMASAFTVPEKGSFDIQGRPEVNRTDFSVNQFFNLYI